MSKIQEVSMELVNITGIVRNSRGALYDADQELYTNSSEISRKYRRKQRLLVCSFLIETFILFCLIFTFNI